MLVLEQNLEIHRLRHGPSRRHRLQVHFDLIALPQLAAGLRRNAVDQDVAVVNQPLDPRSRQLEIAAGQKLIHARPVGIVGVTGAFEAEAPYQMFDLTWPLDFTSTSTTARS